MPAAPRSLFGLLHQHSLRLPSSIRVALFSARSQCAHPRTPTRFNPSQFLRHYATPSKVYQAAARASYLQSFMSSNPTIRKVLATKAPVLLYKAPNNPWHFAKVYALACTFVAGGLYSISYYFSLRERKGLAFFVAPTYVFVGFMLIGIGFWIFTFPVSRVTSIELIPSTGTAAVQLRIKTRFVPFASDQVHTARIGETSIREKLHPIKTEVMEAARAREQSIRDGLENIFIAKRMAVLLGRWIDQKWTSFFLQFKFAVLRFDTVALNVRGDTWKVDCTGFLLEDGQAIDRLIMQED